MATVKCQAESCNEEAVMHFTQAAAGGLVDISYCVSHGSRFIEAHQKQYGDSSFARTAAMPPSEERACSVHFIFVYPGYETPYAFVELLDTAGKGVFGFPVGVHEAADIHRALSGIAVSRPLQIDAMLKMLSELDGELEAVAIYQISSEHRIYGAFARIRRDDRRFFIDMRASDGLVLALLGRRPVLVPIDLLSDGASSTKNAPGNVERN